MTKEQKISKENYHISKNGKCHGFEEVEVSAGDRVSCHSPADCKETELTLEERERSFHKSKCDGCDCNIGNAEYTAFIKEEIKRAEQSLKQKVEKMLEGMIKRNEEAPPADKEEEIDERAYRQALEEAKNNLEDL